MPNFTRGTGHLCYNLAFVAALALTLLILLSRRQAHHPSNVGKVNFGIGISLSPEYGTIAISYRNGSVFPIAKVEGDIKYQEMMYRLSLKSSQHLHSPYDSIGDYVKDIPRNTRRHWRKDLGLPASKDVGVLASMISELQNEASAFLGEDERISAASISIPRLPALYWEDITDAFEHISLSQVEFYSFELGHPMYNTVAVFAGNGYGLCDDYRNKTRCKLQEARMPAIYALAVSYTHEGVTASQAYLGSAYGLSESHDLIDLRLGYDHRNDNPNEDFYWESLREVIASPIVNDVAKRNVTMVLLSGDAAHLPKFRHLLCNIIESMFEVPPIVIGENDLVFGSAKGVAVLAKIALYRAEEERNGTALDLVDL